MKDAYLKIADALENLAKIYRNIAENCDKAERPKEKVKTSDIDISVIRKILAEKSQSGQNAEVKALLAKYGAKKLSDVPKEKYPEVLKDAEEL